MTAAKAALRRKKQFEHSLEQTSAQIMTLEREIYSIETANINKETLDAMKNAGTAMKQIHAGLTIDKVDNVMYAFLTLPLPSHVHLPHPSFPPFGSLTFANREDLREQHAIGEEISEAITSGVTSTGIDEDELDEELAELQQEKLDEDMLKTGNVPVNDTIAVGRLPAAPNQKLQPQQREEEDDEEEELRKLQAEMAM
jgi:charged multivesicular body protein 4